MSYYQKYIEWAIGNGGITVAQKRDIINLSRTAKVQLEDVCMTAFDKKVLPGSVIAVLKKHQSETPKPAVPVATPAPQPKIVPAKEKKTPKVDWKKVGSGGLVALKFVGRHGKRVVSGIGKIRIPKIRVGRKRLPASEKVIEVEKTESAEIEETPVKRQPEKKAVSAPKNSYARKVEEFGPEVDETTQDSVPIIAQVGTATLIPGTGPGASAPTTNPGTVTADDAPETGKPETAPATKVRPEVNPENDNIPSRNRGGFFENLKDSIADKFESFKDSASVWGKRVGVVLVVALLLICGYFLVRQTAGRASVPAEVTSNIQTPPATPKLTPIDWQNAAFLSITQFAMIFFAALVIFGIPADEWRRSKSFSDSFWVLAMIILIMGYSVLAKLLTGFIGPGTPPPFNFATDQLNWIISFVCVAVGIAVVVVATQEGGLDLTPLSGFLTILGSVALISGHLGAIQAFFLIHDGAILPLSQASALLALKQTSQVAMSLVVYVLLGLGAIGYFIEMIRTTLDVEGSVWEKIIYAFTCFVGLIAYLLLKNWLLSVGVPPMFVIVIIVAIGIIAAIIHEQFGGSNISVGVGERRFRDALIPPYDKIAFQVTLGLLLIALTGRII